MFLSWFKGALSQRLSNDTNMNITYRKYDPLKQFAEVKSIWEPLLNTGEYSYWLSTGWIENWIKSLPADFGLIFIAGFDQETPVIAFFLGRKRVRFNRFLTTNVIGLNSTLDTNIDMVTYIEFNSILISPHITTTLESMLNAIPVDWDEFRMERAAPNATILYSGLGEDVQTENGYFVDLDKVRKNGGDYLGLLGAKRRNKIRRAIKEYEKYGAIRLVAASNVNEALEIFDKLVELHQSHWTRLGQKGAYHTEYSIKFNEGLIRSRFNCGEIQLVKLCAGDFIIGCNYCFIYKDSILGAGSGFNYTGNDKFATPGFVCHYYTILHNAELGYDKYDFLAGESDYKKSLSTDNYSMYYVNISRNNLKMKLINILTRIMKK